MNNNQSSMPLDSSSTARGSRLREIREFLHLTRLDLEQDYGIAAASIKNWENARYGGLSESGAKKMIQIFEKFGIFCTLEWLFDGKGENPILASPLSKFNLHMGIPSNIEQIQDEDGMIQQELRLFRQFNNESMDYVIGDDAMLPLLHRGDFVAGIRYFAPFTTFSEQMNELPCIVQCEPGGTLVRLVTEQPNGLYTLVCTNEETSAAFKTLKDVRLISIAPILWIRRKSKPTS